MNKKSEISGFILAGGKSTRMGFDKAFLLINNKPLLQIMIDVIEPFCQHVAISGQNPDYATFQVGMVPDTYSDCGPISGLYSVLKQSSTDWNLIVSVDVPFLNEELIRFLILNIGEYDCVIPQHKAGIEPLAGLYHRRIWPAIAAQISKGNYKLTGLLSEIKTRFVDCNLIVEKYPELFLNINSKEDFEAV